MKQNVDFYRKLLINFLTLTEFSNENDLFLNQYNMVSFKNNWLLTLTCPIGLPPHTPVAQKNAELCTLIASLAKRLFVRVDWTERLRDDSSARD